MLEARLRLFVRYRVNGDFAELTAAFRALSPNTKTTAVSPPVVFFKKRMSGVMVAQGYDLR